MDLGIAGRTAVVSAASKGLGRATAVRLAQEGANLAICARGREALEETAAEIRRQTGRDVVTVAGDVTDPNVPQGLVEAAVKRFGSADILVCNAGGAPSLTFLDISEEQWLAGLQLNLLSTIALCRAATPHMMERRWGRIVNITSLGAKQPLDNFMLSNTARAGVLGFAKTLSNEVGRYGITVNCICPGFTLTGRLKELAGSRAKEAGKRVEEIYAAWENNTALGRLAQPEEIGDCITFLCSERSSYVTGVVFQADGGYMKGIV